MTHIFVRTAEGETFQHHGEKVFIDDDNGMLIITNEGKHVAGYQGSEWRSYHIPGNAKSERENVHDVLRARMM